MNCNGDIAVTYKRETNTNNIRLAFIFGNTSDTLYMPDMNAWYEKVQTYKKFNGRTYVLRKKDDGTIEHIMGTRQNKLVDLYEYYHCARIEKDYAGDVLVERVAKPSIYHNIEEVTLSFNSNQSDKLHKNCWYFENGSKYLIIPKTDIIDLCNIGEGIILRI